MAPAAFGHFWLPGAGGHSSYALAATIGDALGARKLQAIVSDQLNAQLSLDRLEYLFPYGVRVHPAKLVANDPRGRPFDLLTADQIELKLAKLPILPGPLVIERLIITSPAVHLIQTKDGLVGRGITKKTDQPTEERKQKLSEMFELRNRDHKWQAHLRRSHRFE